MSLINKSALEYSSWRDFVYGENLRQPQVDALVSRLKKKDKVGACRIIAEFISSKEDVKSYYELFIKGFNNSFKIVEDNSFLESDSNFAKLNKSKFLFSTGGSVEKGFYNDGVVMNSECDAFDRKNIKQIWLIVED